MAKVAIVMSSYNGGIYIIKEQIDSILNQTHEDFILFIRDDGSKDGTLEFLENEYSGNPKVVLLKDTLGNLGFGNSFASVLKFAYSYADFDFFAFCDQDDYWEPEKIACAVEKLSSKSADKPNMYASNYYICDSQLNIKEECHSSNPMTGVTFQNLFFEGVFPGFTIVINKTLAKLGFIDTNADIYYHDKWVSLISLGLDGEIIYDSTPLAKYRRHDAAASSTNLGLVAKIKWRINNVLNGDFCPRTKKMLEEFSLHFADKVSEEAIKKFLKTFSGKNCIPKLFYGKRLRRSFSGEILLRLILLLGKL